MHFPLFVFQNPFRSGCKKITFKENTAVAESRNKKFTFALLLIINRLFAVTNWTGYSWRRIKILQDIERIWRHWPIHLSFIMGKIVLNHETLALFYWSSITMVLNTVLSSITMVLNTVCPNITIVLNTVPSSTTAALNAVHSNIKQFWKLSGPWLLKVWTLLVYYYRSSEQSVLVLK
jgi:hypothetical protein